MGALRIVVAAWVAASVPIALMVGRLLRGRQAPAPPAVERAPATFVA